jgi:hypothetical protein
LKKKLVPFAILVWLLSCKKDKEVVNPDEVRILKTKSVDANNNVNNISFEYDTQGRISKVFSYTNTQTPTLVSEINYSGNETVIKQPVISNGNLIQTAEVRYSVDNSNRPLKKISTETLEFLVTANGVQKTFITDTTVYEYDGVGLLLKSSRSKKDSVWTSGTITGNWEANVSLTKGTANFTNVNGNINQIEFLDNILFISSAYNRSPGITGKQSEELSIKYEYDKNYANKTDMITRIAFGETQYKGIFLCLGMILFSIWLIALPIVQILVVLCQIVLLTK